MTSNKLVSVILPIYKVEEYLDASLGSLCSQTYKNLEIMCMVDGSPDSSLAICEKFAQRDSRIKVFHFENSGCAKTRNRAISLCSGDYICFIDPDDSVSNNYIEDLLQAVEKEDADIASATTIRVMGNKRKYRLKHDGVKYYQNRAEIFKAVNCPPEYAIISNMYKASLIKDNAIFFEEGISWCDDIRFCVDTLLKCKKLATVESAIYYYNKRVGSISHVAPTEKRQQERFNVRSTAIKRLLDAGLEISKRESLVTKYTKTLGFLPLLRTRVDVKNQKEIVQLFGIIPISIRDAK